MTSRQHETRLRVRGGQDQSAAVLAALVGGVGADVAGFVEDAARVHQHALAGGGDRFQAAALAREQLEAEFVLELLELLGQAGLGGVHALGGQGDVEAGIGDGDEVAELGEGHVGADRRGGDAGPRGRAAVDVGGCRQHIGVYISLDTNKGMEENYPGPGRCPAPRSATSFRNDMTARRRRHFRAPGRMR